MPRALPYAPTAAAYAGKGPHRVVVIDRGVRRDGRRVTTHRSLATEPGGDLGFGVPESWRPAPRDATLVACVYVAGVARSGPRCRYAVIEPPIGSPMAESDYYHVTMLSARYLVVAREARTARAVGSFVLSSAPAHDVNHTGTERPGCPESIDTSEDETVQVLPPANGRFVHRLRPYVER